MERDHKHNKPLYEYTKYCFYTRNQKHDDDDDVKQRDEDEG